MKLLTCRFPCHSHEKGHSEVTFQPLPLKPRNSFRATRRFLMKEQSLSWTKSRRKQKRRAYILLCVSHKLPTFFFLKFSFLGQVFLNKLQVAAHNLVGAPWNESLVQLQVWRSRGERAKINAGNFNSWRMSPVPALIGNYCHYR